MKNKRKLLIYGTLGIAGIIILVVFQSNVIKVLANTDSTFLLKISPPEIAFGTVFPGENFKKQFTISLSDDFGQQGVGDRVVYQLKEKAADGAPPNLCDYISEKVDGVTADPIRPEFLTLGTDESDTIEVELTVPCFLGMCNLGYNGPKLDLAQQGQIFGCELWAEVSDVFYVDELAGMWHFNEGEGNMAYDSSGNGNHGTLINNPAWIPGTHLSFDGIDDYVDIPGIADNPNVITQMAWVKTTSPGGLWGWNVIMTKRHIDDLVSDWATLAIYNGYAIILVDDSFYATDLYPGTTYVADGNWHYIAGVKDGCNYAIYIDGHLENSFVDCHFMDGSPYNLHIGHHGAWNNFFSGEIDEAEVYYRALSGAEILAQYQAGR